MMESPELKRFALDLDNAADVAPEEVRKVVQRGALNIKNDARRRISGRAHLPRYPHSISYDSTPTPSGAYADIGPDKRRTQGALGNVIEYGTIQNAPIPHLDPAGRAEMPRFARAVEDLGVRLVTE
jgi:hypothetical protein